MIRDICLAIAPLPKNKVIDVRSYLNEVEIVRVALTIDSEDAAFLLARNPYIISRYGFDVAAYCIPLNGALEYGKTVDTSKELQDALIISTAFSSLRGYKAAPISVEFQRFEWECVLSVSKAFGVEPVAMVRAGLFNRVRSLKRFDEREGVEKGGAR
ncbi:hypothetical protein [Luteolibacter luteus]|uniref:Uncharacterized protein n=1 Tax=Luteolibacter luteus TaxID=2728835 RepID=A0A858RGL2_9BACT|nr:hypothetical protein [Luteolibacter luteus]QJE95987.1 hypothetical protein HHL09_09395 [Luteolibacter luteus]